MSARKKTNGKRKVRTTAEVQAELDKTIAELNALKAAPTAPTVVIPGLPSSAAIGGSLKLDIGCGQNKAPGFTGIDRMEGADIQRDLLDLPWPFEPESVDEARASHVMEHFWGEEQIRIVEEVYRVLKFGSTFTIIVPYWNSSRMWQDPTHKSPFPSEKCLYFNKAWREQNKLDHYPIKSDFDFDTQYQIVDPHPSTGIKGFVSQPREAQMFALQYYSNVIGDLTLIMKKVKR